MKRNIFYISNTQSNYFPKNSRTKFDQYIDVNNLDYIKNDNIDVGVKSISFDTRQYVDIEANILQPHFMIIQTLNAERGGDTLANFLEMKGLVGEKRFPTTQHSHITKFIDLKEKKDFIICNRYFDVPNGFTDLNYMIEQRYGSREFSNIILVDGNRIIHHIYLHNTQFYYLEKFIETINNVMSRLEFYHGPVKVPSKLITVSKRIRPFPFPLLVRHDIGAILGLQEGKTFLKRLIDYFHGGLMRTLEKSAGHTPVALLVNDVHRIEQDLCYFEIKTGQGSLKINPSLMSTRLYEVRSNISEWSIHNSRYDQLVALFQDEKKQDVLNVQFRNPSFFKTHKEKLSNAQFDINALTFNGTHRFSIGSPTYIQLFVRESLIEMKRPFNIFLDSSCPYSKELYPKNINTDFIIELPERLKFRMNWTVTLKTLFLSNSIHNIEDCEIVYQYISDTFDLVVNKKLVLKNGYYNTSTSFISEIQDGFKKKRMPFTIEEMSSGRVKIKITKLVKRGFKVNFVMSRYLATILGYTSSPKDDQFLRFDEFREYEAPHDPNIFLTYPRNLIVGCNIVENTIFGGQPFKLLRLITNSENLNSDILSFEFLQDEKVALKVREFKSIHISILDATGSPVKSESKFPTKLQLMFSLE